MGTQGLVKVSVVEKMWKNIEKFQGSWKGWRFFCNFIFHRNSNLNSMKIWSSLTVSNLRKYNALKV